MCVFYPITSVISSQFLLMGHHRFFLCIPISYPLNGISNSWRPWGLISHFCWLLPILVCVPACCVLVDCEGMFAWTLYVHCLCWSFQANQRLNFNPKCMKVRPVVMNLRGDFYFETLWICAKACQSPRVSSLLVGSLFLAFFSPRVSNLWGTSVSNPYLLQVQGLVSCPQAAIKTQAFR